MFSQFDVARLLLSLQFLVPRAASVQLWSSPDALPPSMPSGCRIALSQNISCSPALVSPQFAAGGRALDPTTLGQYCTTLCYQSLQTFKTKVDAQCGDTNYQMFANSTLSQSGASIADPLAWAYNVICVQDSTGFCLPSLFNATKTLCSDCSLKYGAAMLGSDYGRNRIQPSAFSSLLSSCSIPASDYPYTYWPTPSTVNPFIPTSAPSRNCTGKKYTIKANDTCQSISQANSIATDRLIAANNIDYNCSSLIPGATLCLGPSCALQKVLQNQTCQDITTNQAFTFVQLIAWNPTIHLNCDNLDVMVGRSICISPPGSSVYKATLMNTSTVTMSSMFPGPYVSGSINSNPPDATTSWYNTQTTFPPPVVTTFIANLTTASLVAARTSFCPITPDDFLNGLYEEDLPEDCDALIEPYCWPDPDAPTPSSTSFPASCTPFSGDSITTSNTPAVITTSANPLPSPLEPGTIATCKTFHKVSTGETCYSIANNYKVSLDQFYTWNPTVGTTCAKLFLAFYVCVSA
ncbi:hypothetical protein HO173_008707 [Letharia columbiana]|uniref:LysM domain-containing protein n=1 Tax=Letharia columbiana TaxID=112416 RepID=A0A8H6FR46_9LECA|nr:uncharacterized protein HO173_008707 [Letharia columbiana]KAF6233163.1 hypothetical protein HO173_008707 [Letharia columbiana]